MLPLLRPLLRRPPRLKLNRSHPLLPLRLQHDRHGPHKEYFQHPSQFPTNAYQLSVPPPEQRTSTTQEQPSFEIATSPSTSAAIPKRRSLLRRLLSSVSIIGISLTIGWAAGTAVVTWDYIQPPFEPGSEEAKDLIEEVDEMLETCLLVQDLRDAGFQEEQMHRVSSSGQHLVTGTLNDVQGFKTKSFRHPDNTSLSVLVFFAGFGVEGWPDYVHGGAITTIMTEAVQQHCAPLYALGDLENLPSGQLLGVSFIAPLRPAEIYAVLVHEQGAAVRPRELGSEMGIFNPAVHEAAIAHGLNAYLISSDSFPPEMIGTFGNDPPMELNGDEAQDLMPTVDSEGRQVSVLTLPDSAFLHAAGQFEVMSRSKHVKQEEGEDVQSYSTRLALETQRALQKIHANVDIGK